MRPLCFLQRTEVVIYVLIKATRQKTIILPLRTLELLVCCCLNRLVCLCYCVTLVNPNLPKSHNNKNKLTKGCFGESIDACNSFSSLKRAVLWQSNNLVSPECVTPPRLLNTAVRGGVTNFATFTCLHHANNPNVK